MPQEHFLVNEIIADHRERMLNLKKYYPFFRLSDISFSWYKEGEYDCLDMGYILMAVLRFFIEENNFKEKEVTYKEYASFMEGVIRRDFGIAPPKEDMAVLVEYIFNKLKNDGKPFVFKYFDPLDKKKKVSRIKLLESRIADGTVWYSISREGIEFYLDTKEIKDESRISVEQLLLEKMIESQDFKGGAQVVNRINKEVDRLWMMQNRIMAELSADVFAGLAAYEEFFSSGMVWFEQEQKLFVKNSQLLEGALRRAETDGYSMAHADVQRLDTELKNAMNNHSRLLAACTRLGVMADEAIKKAKLKKLRPGFDFMLMLKRVMEQDDAAFLGELVKPMLTINADRTFPMTRLDDALAYRPDKEEKPEKVSDAKASSILFEDEIEDARINDNYASLMRVLLAMIRKNGRVSKTEFEEQCKKIFGEQLIKNGDYYSFLVHICHKTEYFVDMAERKPDTFLEDMIKGWGERSEFEEYKDMVITVTHSEDESDIIFAERNNYGGQES